MISNLAEIRSDLANLAQPVDFLKHGRGKTLLDILAWRIQARTVEEHIGPDGAALAPLAESTLRRKAELGQPATISVATGEMMSEREVLGEQTVTNDTAELTYGVAETAQDKAEWFQEGNANQPARFFWDLDERDERFLDAFVDEMIDETIRELGGA